MSTLKPFYPVPGNPVRRHSGRELTGKESTLYDVHMLCVTFYNPDPSVSGYFKVILMIVCG